MSVSKREDTVLSEGTPPRRPLLCVFIMHFTFFSLVFVTCTCLPQQLTSSFVSFPEFFVPQDAAWMAKAPVHFSAIEHQINLSLQILTSKIRYLLLKACPVLRRSGSTGICPAGKIKLLEFHLALFIWLFGYPLTCGKGKF